MLANVSGLIESLNRSGVRYCHWKSNSALSEGLSGRADLDLLVQRHDANTFRSILAQCNFQPASSPNGGSFPSTEHYFGLDSETGLLAHIHAYFRVITGESLAKNFCLPVEDMLLANTRQNGPIRVPTKTAELVLFTIRMMLKHTTLVDLAFLARDWGSLKRETASLMDVESMDQSVKLVEQWLPSVDPRLFAQCVSALQAPAPFLKRLILGHRLRSSLQPYARHSRIRASWTGFSSFAQLLKRRLGWSPNGLALRSGGAVVAFVGPEASGKSTLISQVSRWLGEDLAIHDVHVGTPPSTLITLLPNMLVPLLRLATPGLRPSTQLARRAVKEPDRSTPWVYPLIFALRCVTLAYDRRALLMRAFAQAANGTIVLCDRYPYIGRGAPDGPQLMHYPLPRDRYPVRSLLAALERKLYLQAPSPDLIISLTVPIEVSLARNRTRRKREPEEYVRDRHVNLPSVPPDIAPVCAINTNRELPEALRDVKMAIWSIL
jgi:hypothetical protein